MATHTNLDRLRWRVALDRMRWRVALDRLHWRVLLRALPSLAAFSTGSILHLARALVLHIDGYPFGGAPLVAAFLANGGRRPGGLGDPFLRGGR